MLRQFLEVDSNDNHTKLIMDRVHLVEKNFGEICSSVGGFTGKSARYKKN